MKNALVGSVLLTWSVASWGERKKPGPESWFHSAGVSQESKTLGKRKSDAGSGPGGGRAPSLLELRGEPVAFGARRSTCLSGLVPSTGTVGLSIKSVMAIDILCIRRHSIRPVGVVIRHAFHQLILTSHCP